MIRSALVLMALAGAAQADCAPDRVLVTGDFGQVNFNVVLADDPAERSRGLMFVEEMPTLAGMLFIYETPRPASFWMKNTLIPLDMLFIGDDGIISKIHPQAIPHDETSIHGGDEILAVLEINGGLAQRLGIKVGDVIKHPAFGADAALPCE